MDNYFRGFQGKVLSIQVFIDLSKIAKFSTIELVVENFTKV